jgi:hypothetical protein
MRITNTCNRRVAQTLWCALIVLCVVNCGGGGGNGTSPSQGQKFCSTGTELVLFYPVPGTKVPPSTRSIYVASNALIINEKSLAARPADYNGGPLGAYRLAGPVAEPTPTPTPTTIPTPPSATPTPSAKPTSTPSPFPTPPFGGAVYYVAHGFQLKPHQTYTVELASQSGTCVDSPVQGGIFYTQRF